MRKWFIFVLVLVLFIIIHEGLHIIVSAIFGEFDSVHWNVIGPEVIFKTPVEQRNGFQWALISGVSNIATILLGYLLLGQAKALGRLPSLFMQGFTYFLIILFLFADPLNHFVGPFLYGGDVHGIAAGLGIHHYWLQGIFLIVLLINRELIAQKLLPAYNVETDHPLLRPWFK